MIDRLSEILLALGRKDDAAARTGSANAKLAELMPQTPTYFASVFNINPGSGAVILDSGQLVAGRYEVVASVAGGGAGGTSTAMLAHRDAANAADVIATQLMPFDLNVSASVYWPVIVVATNERVRMHGINDIPAGFSATLYVRRLSS